MTTTAGLDRWLTPAVDSLTRLDPVLGPVVAVESAAVEAVGGTGLTNGSRWRLHDVRWVPRRSCVMAYSVGSDDGADDGADGGTFVAVEIRPDGLISYDLRSDRSLDGILRALDQALVAQRISRLCRCRVRRCVVTPVRYRPGSRCVLRYDAETDEGPVTFFAKVFHPEAFARISPIATRLATRPVGAFVPRLAELWSDLHAVVSHAAPGRSAAQVLADPARDEAKQHELGRRLGDLLVRFHHEGGVAAPEWTADTQLASLGRALPAVAAADKSLALRLRAIRDELARTRPTSGRAVLAHGSFRPGQVIVGDDGRLTALDVDGVRHGRPAFDLATALAHLHWQGVRQPAHRPAVTVVENGLLQGYQASAARLDRVGRLPDDLPWWRAAVLAVAAARRFRRLEVTGWAHAAELVACAEDLLHHREEPRRPAGGPAEAAAPRELARAVCSALGPAARLRAAELVTSRPAGRVVVRVEVAGLDRTRVVPLVAKAFADPVRAQVLHANVVALGRAGFDQGAFRVPQPLAFLHDRAAVVLEDAPGVRLDSVHDEPAQVGGVRLAARWLARLHTAPVVLPRAFSLAGEVGGVRAWADLVGQTFPGLADRATHVADQWSCVAERMDAGEPVPVHKDYHAGHVFVSENGQRVDVIDLDEARHGPSALDVEHFCAYLELAWGPDRATRLIEVFRAEYDSRGDRPPTAAASRSFAAYAWLKIAKQAAIGSGPGRAGSEQERAGRAERALERAEACLTT